GQILLRDVAKYRGRLDRHTPHTAYNAEHERGEEEVHDHAGRDDEHAGGQRLRIEVSRVRLLTLRARRFRLPFHHLEFFHPGHLHVAAERKQRDHVLRLAFREAEHTRTEADREARHLDVH